MDLPLVDEQPEKLAELRRAGWNRYVEEVGVVLTFD